MQFTQQTDYALRILMYVGANQDRLVNITEIAELYKISRSHLTKIVANLANKGYLESIRGNRGGLRLNKKTTEINIGEIIRCFEPLSLVVCMDKNKSCTISENCTLKCIFYEATNRLLETFDRYFLSDLIKNEKLKKQLERKINFHE